MHAIQQISLFGLSLNHILWATWQRKGIILISTLLGLFAAFILTVIIPPKYSASSQILFDVTAERLVSTNQESRTNFWANQVFHSATAKIASPGILKPVALKIMSQPASDKSAASPIQNILKLPDLSSDERLAALIKTLQRHLNLQAQAANQIIVVEYRSPNPAEAVHIANLIASTFIEELAVSRKEALSQATSWLDERSLEAKQKLIEVDKKIEEFKARRGLGDMGGSSALETELNRKREQLSTLQIQLTEARALYETLNKHASKDAKVYERYAESIGSPALDNLRTSLVEALGVLASNKARYGTSHPTVKAQKVHVAQIRAEIVAEVRRKQLSSKLAMEQLAAREQALQGEIRKMETKVRDMRTTETQILELQQERSATKTLFDSMLERVTQTNLQRALNFAQFKVLLNATLPTRPRLPPKLIWVAGGIFGLGFGLLASLVLELLQDRIVTLDQAKNKLNSKIITQVPLLTEKNIEDLPAEHNNNLRNFAKESPKSLFANKLLTMRLVIDALDTDGKSKVVMITSPRQGSGKTLITSNLAGLSVFFEKKTLLIDLDLRKNDENDEEIDEPSCSKLGAYLKETKLDQVFSEAHRTRIGNYDVLRVRPSNESVSLRFLQNHQNQMTELFKFVRENYDHVWIDTPPVEIFTDPLMIAQQVDGVIVIAEWSKTTTRQLNAAIDLIQDCGGDVLGVVLNKVQVDSLISEAMLSYRSYYNEKKTRRHTAENIAFFHE
ncbi:MAG: AAA family ATPase [Alphaproteobacteria bacterium]